MTTKGETLDNLASFVGRELGTSSWVDVDQVRINAFAHATDDHQWIHVDPDRAKDGPFGKTIAHGYLTLSLIIPMWTDILEVRDVHTKVNYGLNKVRFPSPVPSGSKIRAHATLAAFEVISGGAQLSIDILVERQGSDKPACVAQLVLRYLNASAELVFRFPALPSPHKALEYAAQVHLVAFFELTVNPFAVHCIRDEFRKGDHHVTRRSLVADGLQQDCGIVVALVAHSPHERECGPLVIGDVCCRFSVITHG